MNQTVCTRSIPFGRPWISEEDRQAVARVLSGHILTHGPECEAFENEFAKFCQAKYLSETVKKGGRGSCKGSSSLVKSPSLNWDILGGVGIQLAVMAW